MKTILLSALCFCGLLLAGCTSSSCKTCKSASTTTNQSSIYDPATDTTTIKNGENTWYLKGNHTNIMVEAKP